MFCPVCKAEYRPGFTKCADCGADLVPRLGEGVPAAESDTNDDIPTDAEGLELLWSGVVPSPCSDIEDALDAAHIFHKTTQKNFGFSPMLDQRASFIWIDPRDRTAARKILDIILANPGGGENEQADDPTDDLTKYASSVNPLGLGRRVFNRVPVQSGEVTEEEPGALKDSDSSDEPVPDDVVEDFDPDDATLEIWSGEDRQTAEYVKMSLEGVGIGCVLHEEGAKTRILVLPQSEKRAREIVREVVEGTPPQ